MLHVPPTTNRLRRSLIRPWRHPNGMTFWRYQRCPFLSLAGIAWEQPMASSRYRGPRAPSLPGKPGTHSAPDPSNRPPSFHARSCASYRLDTRATARRTERRHHRLPLHPRVEAPKRRRPARVTSRLHHRTPLARAGKPVCTNRALVARTVPNDASRKTRDHRPPSSLRRTAPHDRSRRA